jgi:hypothetical protein
MLPNCCHALVLITSLSGTPAVVAPGAEAAPVLLAQTNPIKGVDPMGDKGLSGPDGWTQAPIARDSAAAGDHKAPGEPAPNQAAAMPKTGGKPMNPGDDPGTAMDGPKNASPGNASK